MDANLAFVIFVLPPVAAFFYVYFKINYPWIFWRTPRREKPEAPEKRHRPGWLARMRARFGIYHRWNRWGIGYSNPILASSVKIDDLRHHALVCGSTGSGKTNALQLLVDAFAARMPIVVVDCKASTALHDQIAAQSEPLIWTIGGT